MLGRSSKTNARRNKDISVSIMITTVNKTYQTNVDLKKGGMGITFFSNFSFFFNINISEEKFFLPVCVCVSVYVVITLMIYSLSKL